MKMRIWTTSMKTRRWRTHRVSGAFHLLLPLHQALEHAPAAQMQALMAVLMRRSVAVLGRQRIGDGQGSWTGWGSLLQVLEVVLGCLSKAILSVHLAPPVIRKI